VQRCGSGNEDYAVKTQKKHLSANFACWSVTDEKNRSEDCRHGVFSGEVILGYPRKKAGIRRMSEKSRLCGYVGSENPLPLVAQNINGRVRP
jgi:hypothetical protein